MCNIDVVELSPSVVKVARESFGVVESDTLRLHQKDGIKFLEEREAESLDIVVVDAADHDAENCTSSPNALEVPPAPFVEDAFFKNSIRKCLTSKV